MEDFWEEVAPYILAFLAMIVITCAITAGVGLFAKAVVPQDRAVKALSDQGFTNIQITGEEWFFVGLQGCDSGDSLKFDATAVNPLGKTVQVYVCSGILKGATIRSR